MATARRFAVVMGMIAVVVVCVSGVWRQSSLESTLLRAFVALLLFSVVGYVCGLLGSAIMKDAVKTQIMRAKRARDVKESMRRSDTRSGSAAAGNESKNPVPTESASGGQ